MGPVEKYVFCCRSVVDRSLCPCCPRGRVVKCCPLVNAGMQRRECVLSRVEGVGRKKVELGAHGLGFSCMVRFWW